VLGNGFEDGLAGETEELGFDDERLNLTGEQVATGALRCARQSGDDGADAGVRLEELFGEQSSNDFGGGVGIDVGFAAERANGGKWVSGPQLTGDDGTLGGVNNLVRDGNARAKLDAERNHVCTITASTLAPQVKYAARAMKSVGGRYCCGGGWPCPAFGLSRRA